MAIAYLVLVSYSGVHHGWWHNLTKPLAVGSTSAGPTFLASIKSRFLPFLLSKPWELRLIATVYISRRSVHSIFAILVRTILVAASHPDPFPTHDLPSKKFGLDATYRLTDLVTTSLLTLIFAAYHLLPWSYNIRASSNSMVRHSVFAIVELILAIFWAVAFVTMLFPKGKDFRLLFHKPPYIEWVCAIVLAGVEM